LFIQEKFKGDHKVSIGHSRTGKSTKAAEIVEEFAELNKDYKIFIYNTQSFKPFSRLGFVVHSYQEFIESFATNQITILNPILNFSREDRCETLSNILQYIFLIQDYYKDSSKQYNVLVVIDEIHQFATKHGHRVPEIQMILSMGLFPYKIELFSITQKIQLANNDIFSESTKAIVFRLAAKFWEFAVDYFPMLKSKPMITEKYQCYYVDYDVCECI